MNCIYCAWKVCREKLIKSPNVSIGMVDKITKLVEDLKKTFEHAEDWETKKTSIPGIFIVKMPKRDEVRLAFNPPNDDGKPSKRKGFFFDSIEEVEAAKRAFTDGRVSELIEAVRKYNGNTYKKSGGDDEVFNI